MNNKKIIYNVFDGCFSECSDFNKDDFNDLVEYIQFKNHNYDRTSNKISFKKKIKLTMKFKCLNWFTYKHSKYLSFDILKVREYDTNKTFYFQFVKHCYRIYPKNFVDENYSLSCLYSLSTDFESNKDSLYDVFKLDIKDCKEVGVQHYKRFTGKNEFFKNNYKILKDINNVVKKDFVIFKTNLVQMLNLIDSPIENGFRDFRFLAVLYNFNPSGSYELNSFDVRQSFIHENVFFVETPDMKKMFTTPIILSKDVQRNWISYDIESECVSHREIFDEHNIITHLGFEYFSDSYYSDFNKHYESFNFCLINIDFHFRQELLKKNPELKQTTNPDDLYENIMYKQYQDVYVKKLVEHVINDELKKIEKNEQCYLYNVDLDLLSIIKTNKYKFVFCSELNIIEIFKKLLYDIKDVDCILTFNGHSYDFAHLSRRFAYLSDKKIHKCALKYLSLYNNEVVPKFFESKNTNTNFRIINMDLNQHYYSIDLFTYVFKFKPDFDSFSLKEVAKKTYNIQAVVSPYIEQRYENVFQISILKYFKDTIKNSSNNNVKWLQELKKREEEYSKSLYKFIKVLLSSNYIYINDVAFKIFDKSGFIKDNDSIYKTNINKIINKTAFNTGVEFLENTILIEPIEGKTYDLYETKEFKWENYLNFIQTVALAKDDIEISDKKIFEKQTTYEIAKYCIHDSLLCRYLMKDLSIKENNDVFSQIYFLPQSQAFVYRNSTNLFGYLFKTCYEEKCFLKKNNKIHTDYYSGGKVFEPRERFLKEPVMLFDFESLYPSIMINCNISPDTLVLVLDLKCKLEFHIAQANIKQMFDPKYYSIVYNINEPVTYSIMVFTKIDQNGNERKGLLSYMLNDLKIKRKEYKKKMKEFYDEGNMFQYVNNNMIQNCIKILMNSVYGLLGSSFHNISCKFTSQAVTLIGVRSISFLADYFDGAVLKDGKLYINNDLNYNPVCSKEIEPYKIFDFETGISEEIQLKLVYGDTDSVMFIPKGINNFKEIYYKDDTTYKKRSYYYVSCIGNKLSDFINKNILEYNLNLEFESIYFDMIIMAKKKYKSLKVEPTTKSGLSIEDIDNIEPDFKEDNKGISLKRRDNCLFQKRCITQLYRMLHQKVTDLRFKEENINYKDIGIEISNFISKIRKELLIDLLNERVNLNDFVLTSAYKGQYKDNDFPTLKLVNDYNKTARDPISVGERFKFLFKKNFEPKMKLDKIAKLDDDSILSELLKNINWVYIDKDITSYKLIVDEKTNLLYEKGERVFFEIYLNKLQKDIKTIFIDDNSDEIYKMLVKKEKEFIIHNS